MKVPRYRRAHMAHLNCMITLKYIVFDQVSQNCFFFPLPIRPTVAKYKFNFDEMSFDQIFSWFCCSGRIPGLSLIRHSLYVGVVEKTPPPPPLTGEQYGKMEPKYPEGGHCRSVLRPRGIFRSNVADPIHIGTEQYGGWYSSLLHPIWSGNGIIIIAIPVNLQGLVGIHTR